MPRRFTWAHRRRLERAADHYLHDCYRRAAPVRVSGFAASLDVTAPYLSRITPEIVGMPPRDFLRARQLATAVRLLLSTPLPVAEIAVRCGFGTAATFYRWFRAVHGTTPAAFREVMK
jgi:AraC-like DNA-binding protein